MAPKPASIDAYIAALPEERRELAETVCQAILDGAPGAIPSISYAIPAFTMGPRSSLYFAVWKAHLGFYPIYGLPPGLEARVAPYRAKKDTLHFPHKAPVPLDLIRDLAAFKAGA
jgi:uncharacterized protein YdhG (YjbR/CyaY superfamily)